MRCCCSVTALAGHGGGERRYSLHFEDEGQNSRRDGSGAGCSLEVFHTAVTAAGNRNLETQVLLWCERERRISKNVSRKLG